MANPSFDEFADMLDSAVNRIPERFCRYLNGGFNLQKKSKREGDYFILGEYIEEGHLGCFIEFYYGSFFGLLAGEPLKVWEDEIVDTVLHEMQHHLESLAGREDLALREMQELEMILQGRE